MSAPLTRPKRVTHPEDRLRRAAAFRFPSVWKRTENKPGRQGSRRASGFLEDTAASPAKVATPGIPRRDSHFFSLGCAKTGAALLVGWCPGGSGKRCQAAAGRRPVTQQRARARTRPLGAGPRRTPRTRNAVEGDWSGSQAAHSRKRGCNYTQARRRGSASKPEVRPKGARRELVTRGGGKTVGAAY